MVALSQSNEKYHLLHLQGLRALAFLAVFAYHLNLGANNGFLGVDVFFVISGFIISLRQGTNQGFSLLAFLIRRIARLLPALVGLLIPVITLQIFLARPFSAWNQEITTSIGSSFFVSNIVLELSGQDYFGTSAEKNLFLHTWSLGAEFQIYVMFGVLLVFLRKIRRPYVPALRQWLFGLSTLSLLFFLVGHWHGELPFGNAFVGFYSPLARFWEFGAGALLATVSTPKKNTVNTSISSIAFFLLIITLFFLPHLGDFTFATTIVVVTCSLLVIRGHDKAVSSLFLSRALPVTIGNASYSLYLWHWPIALLLFDSSFAFLTGWVVTLLTALLGWFSYRYIEPRGSLMWSAGPLRSLTRLLASAGSVAVFALGMGSYFEMSVLPRLSPGLTEESLISSSGCRLGHGAKLNDMVIQSCTWGPELAGEPIVLIGDSIADQYGEVIRKIAEKEGRPFTALIYNACPAVQGFEILYRGSVNQPGCKEFQIATTEFLKSIETATVVLAYTDHHLINPNFSYRSDESATSEADLIGKSAIHERSLFKTVNEHLEFGREVVLVSPIPTHGAIGWDISRCSIREFELQKCVSEISSGSTSSLQSPVRKSFERIVMEKPVSLVDFSSRYCGTDSCSTHVRGVLAYRDAYHLSSSEYKALSHYFEPHLLSSNFTQTKTKN